MYDIITFGSATWDVFLKLKDFKVIYDKDFVMNKGLCVNLGSKIDIENIDFASGGGGTNTAITFNNQGFKTSFCGMIGDDLAGKQIIEELKKHQINTDFVIKNKKKPTNCSFVIRTIDNKNNKERTIFVFRGASDYLLKKHIPWKKLKAKWFYLAPLSGQTCDIFEYLVNFANKNKIKIAVNPGKYQLSLPQKILKNIFKKIDVLILNQEEACFLTKIPFQKEKEIFKKIDEVCPGIAIMTRGEQGVVVSDGKYLYRAKPNKSMVVDKTGAGDSFGSGFISEYIKTNGDIVSAIQFGIANATTCLQKIGAKQGLLKQTNKWQKVKVEKYKLM